MSRAAGCAFLMLVACGADPAPTTLSRTGLYSDAARKTIAPGLLAFQPNYPMWAEGADARRWLQLPEGTRINSDDMDRWQFPVGTRAWQELSLDGKRLETRYLLHVRQDVWWQAAYAWKDDESDALVAVDGAESIRGTKHDAPSQAECTDCHDATESPIIGASALQWSGGLLEEWAAAGKLTTPPSAPITPPGAEGSTVRNTLTYLHANCGHCHDERARVPWIMRIFTKLSVTDQRPEDTATYRTVINAPVRHKFPPGVNTAVAPGDPDHSQLWLRIVADGDGPAMPPDREVPDPAGGQLIRDWISGLQ